MGIVDANTLPGLFGERIGEMLSQNLVFRDLLHRAVTELPHLGNTELMVQIRQVLSTADAA